MDLVNDHGEEQLGSIEVCVLEPVRFSLGRCKMQLRQRLAAR